MHNIPDLHRNWHQPLPKNTASYDRWCLHINQIAHKILYTDVMYELKQLPKPDVKTKYDTIHKLFLAKNFK